MNEEEDSLELENKEGYVEDRLSTVESESEPTKPTLLPGDTLRRKVYLLMDDPTSSKPAFYVSLFILTVITLALINFTIASLPQYWHNRPASLSGIEIFCVVIFTIEYISKLVTADVWYKWAIQPLNIIDLVAILPFYLELILRVALSSLAIVRAVRVVRIFRVFKMGRYSKKLQIISRTITTSLDTIFLLIFLLVISMLILGTMVFYAEQTGQTFDTERNLWIRDIDGKVSPFQSIPDSFWWAIVTLCRVPGYGSEYPVTILGKITASIAALIGVLVIAFPVAVLGQNFKEQWTIALSDKQEKKKRKKKQKSEL